MTIAIAIKVDEGIVLAADTFTSVTNQIGLKTIGTIYNNATKIYKLRKDLSIGITSWGCGRMNDASIKSIIREFRARSSDREFIIDNNNYTVESTADLLSKYIHDNFYAKEFERNNKSEFYCFVAGYDAIDKSSKVCQISMVDNAVTIKTVNECISSGGFTESIDRLICGYNEKIRESVNKWLHSNGHEKLKFSLGGIFDGLKKSLFTTLADTGMPLQDAIDLARFLVITAISYDRFSLARQKMIGGHCDIALITKYKGFRWIQKNKLS